MCAFMNACAHACVHACMRACVLVCVQCIPETDGARNVSGGMAVPAHAHTKVSHARTCKQIYTHMPLPHHQNMSRRRRSTSAPRGTETSSSRVLAPATCVRACVHARACVCVCMPVCAHACTCACTHTCIPGQPSCYAPSPHPVHVTASIRSTPACACVQLRVRACNCVCVRAIACSCVWLCACGDCVRTIVCGRVRAIRENIRQMKQRAPGFMLPPCIQARLEDTCAGGNLDGSACSAAPPHCETSGRGCSPWSRRTRPWTC